MTTPQSYQVSPRARALEDGPTSRNSWLSHKSIHMAPILIIMGYSGYTALYNHSIYSYTHIHIVYIYIYVQYVYHICIFVYTHILHVQMVFQESLFRCHESRSADQHTAVGIERAG